jgi:GTP-binding protein
MFVAPATRSMSGHDPRRARRENDLDVNPIKEKKLTNIRAAGKDEAMLLIPPRR